MEKKHKKSSRKPPCSFCSEALGFLAKPGRLTIGRGCFVFLFNLIACLPVAAQSQAEKTTAGRTPPKTEALSPYRIERLIDVNEEIDQTQIWQMLGLATPGG